MCSDVAIKVENLSKCFHVYDKPRDRVRQLFARGDKKYYRDFWALKDVSFEIEKGETIGIIGRNGAGKSTLLQILCGTLTPTDGIVETQGRVAALLELGAGFNPEFTGRENIYLNAAILGLRKEEINARLDDIVAFADIGDFLDQPVKTYSSGMYVRLAFAVIAHVDADILIVDEALSVGDMYFQAKCMSHIKKLIEAGVTFLFVSHDSNAVKALCRRAVYLGDGKVLAVGPTDEVVDAYYSAGVRSVQALRAPRTTELRETPQGFFSEEDLTSQMEFAARASVHRIKNGMGEWLNVQLLDRLGNKMEAVDFGQAVILRMILKSNAELPVISVAYHIRDRNGFDVVYSDTNIENCQITNVRDNEVVTLDWEFTVSLREGDYTIAAMFSIVEDLSIGKVEVCDFVPLAVSFKVARGRAPIHGAVHWENKLSERRSSMS